MDITRYCWMDVESSDIKLDSVHDEVKTATRERVIVLDQVVGDKEEGVHTFVIPEESETGCCANCVSWSIQDWQPKLSTFQVALGLLFVFISFLPIGIALLVESNSLVEIKTRYDDKCALQSTCSIPVDMKGNKLSAPFYVYYEINGFPQNQRRYVISRSDNQLRGENFDISECDPFERDDAGRVFYPCGLVARTFFNDVINLSVDSTVLAGDEWDDTKIAWTTDVNDKYRQKPLDSGSTRDIVREGENLQLPTLNDQGLMVWMRSASFQKFRKLYRVVNNQNIEKGQTVTLEIDNNFGIEEFGDAEKSIILANVGWAGGKNPFLGILYIIVSILCFVASGLLFYFDKFHTF